MPGSRQRSAAKKPKMPMHQMPDGKMMPNKAMPMKPKPAKRGRK